MKRAVATAGLMLLQLAAGAASAQVQSTAPNHPEIGTAQFDPRIDAFQTAREQLPADSAYFGASGGGRMDGAPLLVRFSRALTAYERLELESAGVHFHRRDDRVVHVGAVYAAFARWSALEALQRHTLLVRAELAWHPVRLRPLRVTTHEISGREVASLPVAGADGDGTAIAIIDSGIDVFHPHFFRPDAGAFAWLDVNGDGSLTPGTDAVDLNGDGEASGNEVIGLLDGTTVTLDKMTENDDDILQPRRDWLYADANRDGVRNFGPDEGFTRLDAAFGEPLFVFDDANRDGVTDIDERLIRLGTSKIRRYVTSAGTFVRGENLIDATFGRFSVHGTAVASIAAGGQLGYHDYVGVAPGADIVMYSSYIGALGDGFDETAQLADLQAAIAADVDVVLHEWTNPFTAPQDGSGNFAAAMDTARSAGVIQVNPTGNLNLSQKHRAVDVAAGEPSDFVFVVDDGFQIAGQVLPYSSVYSSLFWRADQLPQISLVDPDQNSVEVPLDGSIVSIGSMMLQGTHAVTDRGTNHLVIVLFNEDPDMSITAGNWTLQIRETTANDEFVGRISDYWSSWAVGVGWEEPTTDSGTAVYPCTADASFAVAAYGGRHPIEPDGTVPGELRNYSGRGPRLDGAQLVDIAAPDDPFAALAATEQVVESGFGTTSLRTFGGTSGAAPHVAGAFALLRAQQADATPDTLEQQIVQGARADADLGVELPDNGWGAGKLDVFAALTGESLRPQNEPPVVQLYAIIRAAEGVVEWDASGTTDRDGDPLSFRWDFDYDGVWDTDWSASPLATHDTPSDRGLVRLDVRDIEGATIGAVRRYEFATQMEPVSEDMGFVPDGGGPDEPPARRPCGCVSIDDGGAGSASLLFLLFAALRAGRRRRG